MPIRPESIPVLDSIEALTEWRAAQRQPVHFVPTMGNLHQGHLALVEHAIRGGGTVIASIFVNPAQFGPDEDFEHYPRTLRDDLEALASAGCECVWAPGVETMYPLPEVRRFVVRPPAALADCLCGAHRAGHFDGVCNVVMRLLWQVRPDRAVFGEKDYQQLLILRQMVEEFSIPVAIDALPTVRDPDGLAMSSRNRYLTESERAIAPGLYRVLCELAEAAQGQDPGTFDELRRSGTRRLDALGFRTEYVEIRNADALAAPDGKNDRIFAAVRLGSARLIDNVAISRQSCL